MVQRVKVTAANSDDLSWIPRTHIVARKNQPPDMFCGGTHTNNKCDKLKITMHAMQYMNQLLETILD